MIQTGYFLYLVKRFVFSPDKSGLRRMDRPIKNPSAKTYDWGAD
jgi:hypothetical protein